MLVKLIIYLFLIPDDPNDVWYIICGVIIAMVSVGVIIVLVAVTIRWAQLKNMFLSQFTSDAVHKFSSLFYMRANTFVAANYLLSAYDVTTRLTPKEYKQTSLIFLLLDHLMWDLK